MTKQTVITKKRRGPAPTGKGTLVGVRLQPAALAALDGWVKRQDDKPSRPEAVRRLVERALAASQPPKHTASMAPLKSEPAGMERDSRGKAIPLRKRTRGDQEKHKRALSDKKK